MEDQQTDLTPEEKEGVEAIQALQKMAGIDEPFDRALKNWRNFADWEKKSTLNAMKFFKSN